MAKKCCCPKTTELNTTTSVIRSEEYFASTADGATQSATRQLTITRSAVGQWSAVLSPAHVDGVDYHVSFTGEEQSANRDAPDFTIVQGSKTATGFDFQITTGDNGGTADVYIDTPFTIGIDAPVTVLTAVTVLGASVGTPAAGALVSDNFQDGNGNAPFSLQIRNTTGSPIDWIAVISDVDYASIPSLNAGNYTLSTTGAGPYTHTFTGTQSLAAGASVTITGGTPSPAGVGSANGNPEFFIA